MTSREELKELGFKELPFFNIGDSLIYDLGRSHLSVSSLGTPNEMIFLCEGSGSILDFLEGKIPPPTITDTICIRNYDYDGYTSVEEIKNIISVLKVRPRS